MRRLRFLRVLLPVALIVVLGALVVAFRERPQAHRLSASGTGGIQQRVTGLKAVSVTPEGRTLELEAGQVQEIEAGKYHLENIDRLEVFRAGMDPLVVTSRLGEVEGEPGSRLMQFREGVTIRDPAEDIELTLPELDVDEAAGIARADTEVRLVGPNVGGSGSALVYSLTGEPTELLDPNFEELSGGRLQAHRALFHDGLDDVEFLGEVRGSRGPDRFTSGRLRLFRDERDRLQRILGSESFYGKLTLEDGRGVEVAARSADARWDAGGTIESLKLQDGADLRRGAEVLSAVSIDATRAADGNRWSVQARGTVYAGGRFAGGAVWLRADALDARIAAGILQDAEAVGHVRFQGNDASGEADRATFTGSATGGDVRLYSTGIGKARLARDRTRVAATRIDTDPRGERLVAEGKVEATLLPEERRGKGAPVLRAMFRAAQAVHFVSARLVGTAGGSELTFTGNVRGWQGERNLSAEKIVISQGDGTLVATDAVTSRVPRDEELSSPGEGDYVQIGADRLDYGDASRLAVYRGSVRVRMVEGWLEAERLEVELADGGGVAEIRAFDSVQVEFRDPGGEEAPKMVSGSADRLVYVPSRRTVWLHGDATPASVRRLGEAGGITTGRVLRYELEPGILEVESGGVQTQEN